MNEEYETRKIWIKESKYETDRTLEEADNPKYLPNKKLTPGSIVLATELEILADGYAYEHRAVSTKEKQKVYRRYAIAPKDRNRYDIDHLIPLSLGGSNDLRNLWPHPYHDTYGPRAKARLECKLRTLVRAKVMVLTDAQRLLCENWVKALLELLV